MSAALEACRGPKSEPAEDHLHLPISDNIRGLPKLPLALRAREQMGGDGLVFPSRSGRPLSDGTLSRLCRGHNVGCTPTRYAILVS